MQEKKKSHRALFLVTAPVIAAVLILLFGNMTTRIERDNPPLSLSTVENQDRQLGYVFSDNLLNFHNLTVMKQLYEAVMQHSVVILRNQSWSQDQHLSVAENFGCSAIVITSSVHPSEKDPVSPAITRVSNYHPNMTWKGPNYTWGAYWHNDGEFWPTKQNHVVSIMLGKQTKLNAPTGFADSTRALAELPQHLKEEIEGKHIIVRVKDITDFKNVKIFVCVQSDLNA